MTSLEELTQYIKQLSTDAVKTLLDTVTSCSWHCRNFLKRSRPCWKAFQSWMRHLSWNATRANPFRRMQGANPANMVQKRRNEASPTNMSASVPASGAKGTLMPPQLTGQSRMRKNWLWFLQAILPMTPWYCATDSKAITALLQPSAVR